MPSSILVIMLIFSWTSSISFPSFCDIHPQYINFRNLWLDILQSQITHPLYFSHYACVLCVTSWLIYPLFCSYIPKCLNLETYEMTFTPIFTSKSYSSSLAKIAYIVLFLFMWNPLFPKSVSKAQVQSSLVVLYSSIKNLSSQKSLQLGIIFCMSPVCAYD